MKAQTVAELVTSTVKVADPVNIVTRLDFLDGIRAIAAVYVAVFHIQMWRNAQSYHFTPFSWLPLAYGHYSVDVFIVLSGFCLSMSIVKRGGVQQAFRAFLSRRAKRILPAYYGALILSLLIVWFREWSGIGSQGDVLTIPVTFAGIASHIALVHNLNQDWITKINGPLWSIAWEWQLYFVFPIIVGAMYRTTVAGVIVACTIVGMSFHFIPGSPIDMTCPWYLALLAAGAGAAVVCFDSSPRWEQIRNRYAWGSVFFTAGGIAGILLVLVKRVLLRGAPTESALFALDPIVGLLFAVGLIWLTLSHQNALGGSLRRLLTRRPLVWVGGFSYSIYLLHGPLVDICARILIRILPWQSRDVIFLSLLVCLVGIVLIAYGFSTIFEKPFVAMSSGRSS